MGVSASDQSIPITLVCSELEERSRGPKGPTYNPNSLRARGE